MAGKDVKQPGFPTAAIDALVPLIRQLMVDTDRFELRLGDGVTPGGKRIPNLDFITSLISIATGTGPINISFFATTVELAASAPAENILAIVKATDKDIFYRWVAGATPTDNTGITSGIAGYWKVVAGDGQLGGGLIIIDCDLVIRDGFYQGASTALHSPPALLADWSGLDFTLIHMNSTTKAVQVAFGVQAAPNITVMATRRLSAGVWSAWSSVALLPYLAVGSYVFARNSGGAAVTPGNTGAGTDLTAAGLSSTPTIITSGAALSGTWRALGFGNNSGSVTLWQRIL